MNNKSKVIHEIEILLIVGNESDWRIFNGFAPLNCIMFWIALSSFACSYAHCLRSPQTSFFVFVFFSSCQHKHNWFHDFVALRPIRDFYQCFETYIRVTIRPSVINLLGRSFCFGSGKKRLWVLFLCFAFLPSRARWISNSVVSWNSFLFDGDF